MTLFNPVWRVTIGGVNIKQPFWLISLLPAGAPTFMSKLMPDIQTSK
jgi:hypothetical protein